MFKYLVYALYAGIILIIFTYWNFPYNTLKEKIEYEYMNSFDGNIKIESISPMPPLGLSFNQISIYLAKAYNLIPEGNVETSTTLLPKGKVEASIPFLSLGNVRLKLNPISLFYNKKEILFDLSLYGGTINGRASIGLIKRHKIIPEGKVETSIPSSDHIDINISSNLSRIDLKQYPWNSIKSNLDLITAMILNGSVNLQVSLMDNKVQNSAIDFNLAKGAIETLSFMSFSLPSISYDKIIGNINIKHSQATVNNLELSGKDINFIVKGNINFNRGRISSSPIDLTLHYKISPIYEKRLGLPLSLIRTKKDTQGFSNIRLKGTLSNPIPILT